jgi:hypothetical protein
MNSSRSIDLDEKGSKKMALRIGPLKTKQPNVKTQSPYWLGAVSRFTSTLLRCCASIQIHKSYKINTAFYFGGISFIAAHAPNVRFRA